jgi:cytochrome c peroxidase
VQSQIKLIAALVACLIAVGVSDAPAAERSDLSAFPVPLGLIRPAIPPDSPITVLKVQLGKLLFNDTRFSADGLVSCGTCHQAEAAFVDGLPLSTASNRQRTTRNTPTVLNVAYFSHFNWDGKASSLEEQALTALINPGEMGSSEQKMRAIVTADPTYATLFAKVFGTTSPANVVSAIAAYERTLLYANSPFDRYLFCGDGGVLSESAKRGYRVFLNKGNCIVCHQIEHWSLHPFGPNYAVFTDDRFHNLGVGMDKPLKDPGRYAISGDMEDFGAFKTPSIRNVALTAPYMHDGSLATLADVVDFYAKGGIPNENLDPGIQPLDLTASDKADLVEFLRSLTGSADPVIAKCTEDRSHEK